MNTQSEQTSNGASIGGGVAKRLSDNSEGLKFVPELQMETSGSRAKPEAREDEKVQAEKVGISQIPTNPVSETPSSEALQDEGKEDSQPGLSLDDVKKIAANRLFDAFNSNTVSKLANFGSAPKSFGSIDLFGGISNSILEVPQMAELVLEEDVGIVDCKAWYKWSDGRMAPEIMETLLSESFLIPLATNRSYQTLLVTEASYYYKLRLEQDIVSALSNSLSALDMSKKMKTWMGGKDDTLAFNTSVSYGMQIGGGDNHIAYLTNMCRYFWSAVAGQAIGAKVNDQFSVTQDYIEVSEPHHWQDTYGRKHIAPVRSCDGNADYNHFLATCCVPGTSRYPMESDVDGTLMETVWDRLDLNFGMRLRVASNRAFDIHDHNARWIGDHDIIRAYIERYVVSIGAEAQLGEALRATLTMPYMCLEGEVMTLPLPHHISDFFAGLFTPSTERSPFVSVDDVGPFRQIISGYMVHQMICESENQVVEASVFGRNLVSLSNIDKSILARDLRYYTTIAEAQSIALMSVISGINLDFYLQYGYGIQSRARIAKRFKNPYSFLLPKLLISAPLKGSYAHLIRRGEIMEAENKTDRYYRVSFDNNLLLYTMGFKQEGGDITGLINNYRWDTTMRVNMELHPSKKAWYNALRDKRCRLYLEYFEFGKDKQPIDTGKLDDEMDELLRQVALQMERKTKIKVAVPALLPGDSSFNEFLETTFKEEKDGKQVIDIAGVRNDSPINRNKLERWGSQAKASLMAAGEKGRSMKKENTANRLYMDTESDNSAAREFYRSQEWVEVDCGGEGDCGPKVFMRGLEMSGNTIPKIRQFDQLRRFVSNRAGVGYQAKEWWMDVDFTLAGCIFDKHVILHYVDRHGDEVVRSLSPIKDRSDEGVIVIRNIGNFHWVLLCNKKGVSGFSDWLESVSAPGSPKSGKAKSNEQNKNIRKKGGSLLEECGLLDSEVYEVDNTVNTFRFVDYTNKLLREVANSFGLLTSGQRKWAIKCIGMFKKLTDSYSIVPSLSADVVIELAKGRALATSKGSLASLSVLGSANGTTCMGCYQGISPHVPLWVVRLRKIYQSDETWRYLEVYYNQGAIPKELIACWHMLLFPNQAVPIKLEIINQKIPNVPLGCGCFFCNNKRVKWGCAHSTGYDCQERLTCCAENHRRDGDISKYIPKKQERLGKNRWRAIDAYFPHNSRTGQRKSNVSVGSVMKVVSMIPKVCPKMWAGLRKFLVGSVGSYNNLIACRILWLVGNTCSPSGHIVANKAGIVGNCTLHWLDVMKEVHEVVRTERGYGGVLLEPADHSQILYMHLFYGRSDKEVDWKEEIKIRTGEDSVKLGWNGSEWNSQYGDHLIEKHLREVISNYKPKSRLVGLEERFKQRISWITGGAAPQKGKLLDPETAKAYCGEEVRANELKGNKRSWAEKASFNDIEQALSGVPIQRAFAHKKGNELAKIRAIYGTSVEHYILEDFMMSEFEAGFYHKKVDLKESGGKAARGILERQSWSTQGKEMNSYDFKGFNEQHSHRHLELVHQLITEEIVRKNRGDEAVADFSRVGKWVSESYRNQKVYIKEENRWYDTTKGMFSGCRATTVNNTLLNLAYMGMARDNYMRLYGSDPLIESLHHGDDVIAVTQDHVTNNLFSKVALKSGLESNLLKLLSDAGYMEYLRLLYYPNGEVLGSLGRAIASFVCGNWESELDNDAISRATSIWEQISVLLRRGLKLELARGLCSDLVEFLTSFSREDLVFEGLDMRMVSLSRERGGLGLGELGAGIVYSGKDIDINIDSGELIGHVPDDVVPLGSRSLLAYANEKVLPSDAKIEGGDKKRFLDRMFASTGGTELPRRIWAKRLKRDKVKEAKRVFKAGDKKVPSWTGKRGTCNENIDRYLRLGRRGQNLKRKMQVYDKYKTIVNLASTKYKSREEIWNHIGVPDEVLKLSEDRDRVDRTDGGLLSPHFYSAALDYSTYVLLEPWRTAEIVDVLAKDRNIERIRY